ncbi:ABC-F family ATP-binding cassette domain-containing protein [Alteribacter natronophilus]|uniref:ABC-F family ATP-binding cassette domain-containing protein n=1 Tax=Alteribacter natronophilus TaxID=2583810 RepID=UPI00110E2415|nr:ABC-F family ATP-binding cassette domain-containing protein [Alteribacter natronophilus]TMW70711.1 ABC-F family ATP-binding cassette domain-containing protein [Alteribacter natronophilus]
MTILSVDGLTKTYGDKVLFDSVSFSVSKGERIGLIGVNGTGKSTLLKVLAGIEGAEAGRLDHANDFHIEYLPQEPELDPDKTVLDQIYDGDADVMRTMRAYEHAAAALEKDPADEKKQAALMKHQQFMDEQDAWDANTTARTVLTRLGITDFAKRTGELSGGQKKRVAIARALIQPADILILDEPTNHLDNVTIEWLEGFLAQYKGAIILVTHDRYFLNRVTSHIFELDHGSLYAYEGNYETYLQKRAEREEQAEQQEAKHRNILRRELAWLKRGAKARTTKQKARIQRAEDLQEQSFTREKKDLDFSIGSHRLGKKVIELNGITKSLGGNRLFEDVDCLVIPGDRIGIIGPNGTGKSTLLNVIAGRLEADRGTVETGETVRIGYYTQDHQDMEEDLRVIEYIKEAAEVVYTSDGTLITAEQMLERFMFPRSVQWNVIRRLSGGERRRLYLLRVLMGEPNVLFLDEPTNDLDTQTLSILEDYLDQFPGVVITVSHDRYFLDRVVGRLLVFTGNGRVEPYYGNYSEYMESDRAREVRSAPDKSSASASEPAADANPDQRKKTKKLSYREQQEWNTIEDRISALEERLEEIASEITDAGSDSVKVQELFKEQQNTEDELEQAMERWTELSEIVEEIEAGKQNQ